MVSGTWWVSSSSVFDVRTTYPLHAGSTSVDEAGAIHFDGARKGEKEPGVILLAGIGPVNSVQVDESSRVRKRSRPPRPAPFGAGTSDGATPSGRKWTAPNRSGR